MVVSVVDHFCIPELQIGDVVVHFHVTLMVHNFNLFWLVKRGWGVCFDLQDAYLFFSLTVFNLVKTSQWVTLIVHIFLQTDKAVDVIRNGLDCVEFDYNDEVETACVDINIDIA